MRLPSATWRREPHLDPWPLGGASITPTIIDGDSASWAHQVADWFSANGSTTIYWPDGWQGRPWDNAYFLTFAAARSQVQLLELNTDLLLLVYGGATIPDTITLTVFGFTPLAADGGGMRQAVGAYDTGSLLFLGAYAALNPPWREREREQLPQRLTQRRWRAAHIPHYRLVDEARKR